MACAHRHALRGALKAEAGIHVLDGDLSVERANEEVQPNGTHQGLGKRIVDQPLTIGQHALCGDHGRRRADAGCQIPGVVVSPGHHAPRRVAVRYPESPIILTNSSSGRVKPCLSYSSLVEYTVTSQPCDDR